MKGIEREGAVFFGEPEIFGDLRGQGGARSASSFRSSGSMAGG